MADLFLPVGAKICKGCRQLKPLTQFYSAPTNRDGLHTCCKACRCAYMAAHYGKNASRIKARVMAAYAADPEPARQRERRRYQDQKEKLSKRHKAWRKANWERLRPIFVAARNARDEHIKRATPPWADPAEIAAIYRQCDEISRLTGVKHNVDHIVPLRGRRVSGLHVPGNLQIITEKANKMKHNRHGGD